MRAWSLFSHDTANPYAGHGGYDDVPGRRYSYDSDVPNHRNVAIGDLIIVRGPDASHGAGFVSRIKETKGTKQHNRCPQCRTSQLERRKTLSPPFRCTNGHAFDKPVQTEDPVTRFRAEFGSSYLETEVLSRGDLEHLSLRRSQQNAMRELHLGDTLALLRRAGVIPTFTRDV